MQMNMSLCVQAANCLNIQNLMQVTCQAIPDLIISVPLCSLYWIFCFCQAGTHSSVLHASQLIVASACHIVVSALKK